MFYWIFVQWKINKLIKSTQACIIEYVCICLRFHVSVIVVEKKSISDKIKTAVL